MFCHLCQTTPFGPFGSQNRSALPLMWSDRVSGNGSSTRSDPFRPNLSRRPVRSSGSLGYEMGTVVPAFTLESRAAWIQELVSFFTEEELGAKEAEIAALKEEGQLPGINLMMDIASHR